MASRRSLDYKENDAKGREKWQHLRKRNTVALALIFNQLPSQILRADRFYDFEAYALALHGEL